MPHISRRTNEQEKKARKPSVKRASCTAIAILLTLYLSASLSACSSQFNPDQSASITSTSTATSIDSASATSDDNETQSGSTVLAVDARVTCSGKVNPLKDSDGGVAPDDDKPYHPLITCTSESLGFTFKVPSGEDSGWACDQVLERARTTGIIFNCSLGSAGDPFFQVSAYCLGENGQTWRIDSQADTRNKVDSESEQFFYDAAASYTASSFGTRRLRHGSSVVSVSVPLSSEDFETPSLFYKLATGVDWPSGKSFSCQG